MSIYTVSSVSGGVANISGEAGTGTVDAATLTGHAYVIDSTASTSAGSASKVGDRWHVTQSVASFEARVPFTAPTSVTVSYSSGQLGIAPVPSLNPHTDGAAGHISANASFLLNYWEWDANYQSDSAIAVGPADGTFVDGDGRSWKVSDLGPAATRAARFVDWRDRTPQLAANPAGQLNTASSVTLAADTTYFGRGPARRGTGAGQDQTMFYCQAREGWLEEYSAGELGLIEPPEQVTEPFGDERVEVGFDEQTYDPTTGLAGGSSGAVGVRQQLRIKVPNVFTQMTLGTAYANADGQGFAHMGFGVETAGHVFISAGAPGQAGQDAAGNNRMKLQSHGDMTVYSATGGLNMGGLGGVMIATGGGSMMHADGGVLISGGVPGAYAGSDGGFDQLTAGRNIPELPAWINSATTTATVIGAGLAGFDAYIGLTGAKLGMKRAAALGMTDKPVTTMAVALAAGPGLLGVGMSALNAVGPAVTSFLNPSAKTAYTDAIAGTTIWGMAGWIGGTLATMGLYSGAGTCIWSLSGVSILARNVGIDAKDKLEVSAKTAQLKLDEGIDLVAGGGVKISGRTGAVEIAGAEISIGDLHGTGKQAATNEISILGNVLILGAKNGASLMTDKNAHIEGKELASISGGDVTIVGKEKVEIGAKTAVNLESSTGIHLSVGKSAIHVTKSELSIAHVPGADNGDYAAMKGYLDEINAELKTVADDWIAYRKQALDKGFKKVKMSKKGLALVKKLKDQQKAFKSEVEKAEKALEKNHTISVKSAGIFFKLGTHTFKVTKQGFENAALKVAK